MNNRIKTINNLKTIYVASGVGLAGVTLFVCWFLWGGRAPQIGADEETFAAVDALFTAVTARDERLLSQCEERLSAHKNAQKLPRDAADHLDRIIKTARSGQWRPAAERLYEFMQAQRREGGHRAAG